MSSEHTTALGEDIDLPDEAVAGSSGSGEPTGDAGALSWTRPALRAVQHDQSRVVKRPRDGFKSVIGVIRWLQKTAVVTLGEIDDDFYVDAVVRDDTLQQALLTADARRRLFRKPLSQSVAQEYRDDLIVSTLTPACIRAYTTLGKEAAEYTERDVYQEDYRPGDLDPEAQEHTAMRPGYDVIAREQRKRLQEFWNGFGSRRELVDWLHDLLDATEAELPEDFAASIIYDDAAVDLLLADDSESHQAATFQDWFLGTHILPAFAAGVRALNPSEVIHAGSGGVQPYGGSNE